MDGNRTFQLIHEVLLSDKAADTQLALIRELIKAYQLYLEMTPR